MLTCAIRTGDTLTILPCPGCLFLSEVAPASHPAQPNSAVRESDICPREGHHYNPRRPCYDERISFLHGRDFVARQGEGMDKHARRERIEKLLAMREELSTLDELPLPERFRKLVEWAESHLAPAEQEWLYQQWQRDLESHMEHPSRESAP
jgi:hypothetical protein